MSGNNVDPQAGQNRPLPKKEGDLFKSVVKHYESKQYKKGVKAADGILRKFPNHGETLAMKGLTLNCMGKREDAHEFVRKGLRNDMRSHVCWHVFGLLHRSERNYNEAIKAYKQALRIDVDNLQILRDLSLLQIQMRDLSGFVVTRHSILNLKPNHKNHWLAFALAKHLAGDREGAISVIDIYLGTLNGSSPELQRGFESSELVMYRNLVLSEMPDGERKALEHLDECKKLVVDEGAWMESKGTYHLALGEYEEAKLTFLSLFQRGASETYRAHTGYMCAVLQLDKAKCAEAMKYNAMDTVSTMIPLTGEQKQALVCSYRDELLPLYPRSRAIERIPLTLLDGENLKNAIDAYCRKRLTRGVPSLGLDLSALFVMQEGDRIVRIEDSVDIKAHPVLLIIVGLLDGYLASLSACHKFSEDSQEEPPSTLLWAWYLRAQMHKFCGEIQEALAVVETCLAHTPTAIDVYELKAILLESCGDVNAAAECLDVGRDLDKQDRYINNMTTKYMLRADREDVALERISLFTRHEGNPEQNLYDMQCTWYELELAACLARKGIWGKALKKYVSVEKHFEDFHEDQFDFHSYCIRKVTLRSYVDVLRFEDQLWGQDYYFRAAEGIITTYLHLFDNPKDALTGDETPDYSKMTPSERKKAKNIARKKKKKKDAAAAVAVAEKNGNDKSDKSDKDKDGAEKPEVKDEDPNGALLLKKDALEEAKKYVVTLVNNSPRCFKTWILQYDVAIRRKKKTMALQALYKAKAIDPESSELFARIVDFAMKESEGDHTNPLVKEVVAKETARLLGDKSVQEFVTAAAARVKSDPFADLPRRIAVANAIILTNTMSVAEAADIIVHGGMTGRRTTIETCRHALKSLEKFGEDANSSKEAWISEMKLKFPLAVDL